MFQKPFPRVLLVLIALGVGTDIYLLHRQQTDSTPAKPTIPEASPSKAQEAAQPLDDAFSLPNFSALVAQNGPAVVNISARGNAKVPAPAAPLDGSFSGQPPRPQLPLPLNTMPSHNLGSGFIVRSDGIVMTNAHVVEDASEVTVKLTDKREFKARLVGLDKPTDTAVLKIEAQGLPAVRLGDPARAAVGDWVLAIGSPYGFENSVSAGIISAKSRSIPGEGYVPFIQTDAAVNPGNSGGPLFNVKGEVIGINAQIYTQSGGYQGLSFAVPIDVALKVEQQLLLNGKVDRGRLGMSVQELTQGLADSFGLASPAGALVISTASDGSAAKAGIRAGDVVLKLNGVDIVDPTEMGPLVADLHPGSKATLTVWRDAKPMVVTMSVNDANEGRQEAAETAEFSESRLGLVVRALASGGNGQANAMDGLLVEQSSGASAQVGIAPGDVVLAVNGHPVANPRQLRELVVKAEKHVALLIRRREEKLFVAVDLG